MKQLLAFGKHMNEHKLLKSANYVKKELGVRIAHRIRDFQALPFIVGTNPRVEIAYGLYCEAFEELRKFKVIDTIERNNQFCDLLSHLLRRHLVVIPNLAAGMKESQKHLSPQHMDKFMDDVLQTRIGRRVLAEQHITLSQEFIRKVEPSKLIGIIDPECHAGNIVEKCSALSREVISQEFNTDILPKVLVDGHLETTFMYVPDHVEYIIFELLKNALRFQLIQWKSTHSSSEPPPVNVTICSSNYSNGLAKTIIFRISDQGGGFSKQVYPIDNPDKVWSFSHQFGVREANFNESNVELAGKLSDSQSLNSNFRIGLQLARVFTHYWGGTINVKTMYGYGSDLYVQINAAGDGTERLTSG